MLVDGVYSIKVTDSLLAQVYYVPRANEYLEEVASDIGLLILNGSFENTTVDATKPDSWVITETSTGSIIIDTTIVNHGSKSLNFTSVDASGAGSAVTENRFNVTPNQIINVDFDVISTAVNTRTIISIVWCNGDCPVNLPINLAGSPVSTTVIYDDGTANPTSWATKRVTGQAPPTAFSAELKIEGMAAGGATMIGSTRFDNVIVRNFGDATQLGKLSGTGVLTTLPFGKITFVDQHWSLFSAASATGGFVTYDMSASGGVIAPQVIADKPKYYILKSRCTAIVTNLSNLISLAFRPVGSTTTVDEKRWQLNVISPARLETPGGFTIVPADANGDFQYQLSFTNVSSATVQVFLVGYIS